MDVDVMDNDFEGLKKMSKELLSCGVTSFLPTTLTSTVELLNQVSETVGKHYKEVTGAKIQGLFFEGPFFTEKHKGAQNPAYFMKPDIEVFKKWQELSGGLIKKIAIAPEMKGSVEFAAELAKEGVSVAMGHSDATYIQAKEVIDAGASIFVHTYNGMSGLNHREPGMVGAAMTTKDTFAELICDGHHVNPAAIGAMINAKTVNNIVLITDCMRAGGMPDGDYFLGDLPVVLKNGAVRLKDGGSLAGSVLKLYESIKNVVNWGLVSASDAIRMATEIPAKSCHIEDSCGSIRVGRAADFVVLSNELELEETYLDGISVYKK
jgi:N-acetylglucosamine-6-phosphate deacetylase